MTICFRQPAFRPGASVRQALGVRRCLCSAARRVKRARAKVLLCPPRPRPSRTVCREGKLFSLAKAKWRRFPVMPLFCLVALESNQPSVDCLVFFVLLCCAVLPPLNSRASLRPWEVTFLSSLTPLRPPPAWFPILRHLQLTPLRGFVVHRDDIGRAFAVHRVHCLMGAWVELPIIFAGTARLSFRALLPSQAEAKAMQLL